MSRTLLHVALVAALLIAIGALGVIMRGGETSAAQPLHGVGLAKGCNSPIAIGQLYTCDVVTINNVDSAGDTLTITSIVDVVHAGAGDQTSANLLPGLSHILSGGATCSVGQLICTLPAGSSITTASQYGFYYAQASDPNPLPDTIHLTWQDLCTSLALNCPKTDQMATAGSSARLQSPTPSLTATPTSTITPISGTTTPTPLRQLKSCDPGETATNVGPGPVCNLFICQAPAACAGPGEGDLIVIEHVDSVATVPDTLGLGAYEFNVEFDSAVIESLNPADIIFSAGSASAGVAPATSGGYPAGFRGVPDCSLTIPFENAVRFVCVTDSPNAGPAGSFDLASLDLVPAADDVQALFPGNDNGIPTLIKDNQCRLTDVLGYPVENAGAGLLPTCGDVFVSIRILEADLNLDCVVDLQDEAAIAMRYGAYLGSALYDKWYDLEPRFHDGDIDLKDLQKVFGRDGSTCQNPIPAQTPVAPQFDLSG